LHFDDIYKFACDFGYDVIDLWYHKLLITQLWYDIIDTNGDIIWLWYHRQFKTHDIIVNIINFWYHKLLISYMISYSTRFQMQVLIYQARYRVFGPDIGKVTISVYCDVESTSHTMSCVFMPPSEVFRICDVAFKASIVAPYRPRYLQKGKMSISESGQFFRISEVGAFLSISTPMSWQSTRYRDLVARYRVTLCPDTRPPSIGEPILVSRNRFTLFPNIGPDIGTNIGT
jgi:hypothetical protein